jgi:O-acetyl-ADP-ribose deacetylase (regulator of RNase III)
MQETMEINGKTLHLMKGDIADMELECFVFYAQHDLKLGSGFGNVITVRGGPSIQEELSQMGTLETTEVILSSAGEMKTQQIMHAVGPRFLEEDMEGKLRQTMQNCLQLAADKGLKQLAFPAMGAGFYGVELPLCAKVMFNTITEFLSRQSSLAEIIICVLDSRELKPFAAYQATLSGMKEKA